MVFPQTNYYMFYQLSPCKHTKNLLLNDIIKQASHIKFLDHELTWKNHINSVVKHIIKSTALIAKLRHYTNKNTVDLLCIGLSISYLWESSMG